MADEQKVKVKLGQRPKSFDDTVEFSMLEGGRGVMGVTFKYRTRKELAKLTDEVQAVAKAQTDADIAAFKAKLEKGEAVEPLTQVDLLDREISVQVDYLMKAVEDWNLDVKFDRDAVEQLADEIPAAITALIEKYRAAINQGRLGNSER